MRWQPHEYQKRAAKFLLQRGAAALFLEPGLGKTAVTLAALKTLKQKQLLRKALVIAPLRVCYSVWPAEVEKWEDFSELRVAVLHGKDKEAALKSDADVYVINPEGLGWLLQSVVSRSDFTGRASVSVSAEHFKAFGFDTLVVDELSKFKHPRTQRFKALKQVLHTFERRWGLTGSPAANGLMDLFGQCYVLDMGAALGKYITHYRAKYFVPHWNGFDWTLRDGADKEIFVRVKPLALRMAAADYLELPQLVENRIEIELPSDAREVYRRLEKDLIARIDEGVVVAANAAAASTKCRQVANGAVYVDAEVAALVKHKPAQREWADVHDAKVEALTDLVEELQGQPLLVGYEFEHDRERLVAALGKGTPWIGGGVSAKESDKLVARWNAGELPVLLGHPQSIGHGLNLQGVGAHVCWFSPTWNYELHDQFIRRVLRQGNKSARVFVHYLVARGTVDEAVLTALRSKERGQAALFEALLSRRKTCHTSAMPVSERRAKETLPAAVATTATKARATTPRTR